MHHNMSAIFLPNNSSQSQDILYNAIKQKAFRNLKPNEIMCYSRKKTITSNVNHQYGSTLKILQRKIN